MQGRFSWHFKKRGMTIEWRYFNFKCKKIAGFFTYMVFRYAGKIGKAYLVSRIYMGKKVYGGVKKFRLADLGAKDNCFVFSDHSNIKFLARKKIAVSGNSNDISWNLEYTDSSKHKSPLLMYRFGVMKSEDVSWKLFMPCADVKGEISVKGKRHKIDCHGYMDGNWGRWLVFDLSWRWLQLNPDKGSKKHLSVIAGDIDGSDTGEIIVIYKGKWIVFKKASKQYSFEYKKWDKRFKPKIPKLIEIRCENSKYVLKLKAKPKIEDKFKERTPFVFLDFYIFEEIVDSQIELYKKQKGKLKLLCRTKETGFAEYSKVA